MGWRISACFADAERYVAPVWCGVQERYAAPVWFAAQARCLVPGLPAEQRVAVALVMGARLPRQAAALQVLTAPAAAD